MEHAILRCLEKTPADRPSSALAVASALPGGDPLAAALAAGETPSPEMVAGAGEAGGLRPGVGLAFFLILVIGLVGIALYSGQDHLVVRIGMEKPPQMLAVEARQIVEKLGYTDPPVDDVYGLHYDDEYLEHRRREYQGATRWKGVETVRPAPIRFFYRQSPRFLIPMTESGTVTPSDPPVQISGMVNVGLDARGRLVDFLAVPPQVDDSEGPWPEPDWSSLHEAAGLSASTLTRVRSTWNPLVASDSRTAWEGTYDGQDDIRIRVEAAAFHGKPVWFQVIPPWSRPTRIEEAPTPPGVVAFGSFYLVLLGAVLFGGGLLARRNVRLGRADRRGAFRLAVFVFVVSLSNFVLQADHVPAVSEVAMLWVASALSLAGSCLLWLAYMALEPYARRLWPDSMISWTRLLDGRVRDPRIGRDVLIGGFTLVCAVALQNLYFVLGEALFDASFDDLVLTRLVLPGGRGALILVCSAVAVGLVFSLGILLVVLLLRVILRKQWIGVGLLFIALVAMDSVMVDPIVLPASALWTGIFLFVLFRFGLLAAASWFLFFHLVLVSPLAPDLSLWYTGTSLTCLLVAVAIAAYAFWISRAGRPLFRDAFMEKAK